MKLESQMCSLELAKRLKKLGVNQQGVYIWRYEDKLFQALFLMRDISFKEKDCVAFTVAELGELLPSILYPKTASRSDKVLFMGKDEGIYHIGYRNIDNNMVSPVFSCLKEADVRAHMLIHLLENKLINLTEE